MTTTQAAALMKNGDIPMLSMPLTMSDLSLYIPFCRCSSSSGLLSSLICHRSVVHCARIVARAAPRMPQPRTKMNSGARMMFITTVMIVACIACLGWPDARMAAFIPKYRCVTTLPNRMIPIKSLAKGSVASLAPKKKSISSRKMNDIAANRSPTMTFRVTRLPRICFAES